MLATFRCSIIASALVLSAAPPALAAMTGEPRSVTVNHADLDLATTAGVARLEARVRHAANSVCGLAGHDLAARAPIAACRETALTNARPKMALAIATAHGNTQLARNDTGLTVSAR